MSNSPNKAFQEPNLGDYVASWDQPLNGNFQSIDSSFSGQTVISGLTNQNYAMSQTQLIPPQIVFQGNLSANIIITIPGGAAPIAGNWIFINQTTGLFSITLQNSDPFAPLVALGTTIILPQGYASQVSSDGTNTFLSNSRNRGVPTGGGTDAVFYLNGQSVNFAYSIPAGNNAFTGGPITVNVIPTIPAGSSWDIV